jgi:hypothetical protein
MSADNAFTSYFAGTLLGKQIEVITPDQLSAEEAELIPLSWLDITGTPGRQAVEQALSLWSRAIPGRLPQLLNIFDRFGYVIHLARVTLESEPKPSVVLLYVFHDRDAFTDEFQMRIGFPPKPRSDLPDYWEQFPDGIRNL